MNIISHNPNRTALIFLYELKTYYSTFNVNLTLNRNTINVSQAERARKNAENELHDTTVRLSEVTIQITALTNDKRRMEADIAAMQSDLDDALNGRGAAEERADRLQAEVARLAEELRQEQENYKNADSLRKQLEIEIREITIRLEEAEAFAMREGKRQIAKLQARVGVQKVTF